MRPLAMRHVGRRSVLALVAVALVVGTGYALSLSTKMFSVRQLEVTGVDDGVARDVRTALAETRGTSLVGIDLERLAGLVESIPAVTSVSFDRAFPHTLRVHVVPQRVVGVVRQGPSAFLVAATGRVVDQVDRTSSPRLPRIWAQRSEPLQVGAPVPRTLLPAVRTVAPLRRVAFPGRVASVKIEDDELRLRLGSGLDVRLGRGEDVLLKLAVAGKVLPLLADDVTYLDVSVPERPVSGSAIATAAALAAQAAAAAPETTSYTPTTSVVTPSETTATPGSADPAASASGAVATTGATVETASVVTP